MHEKVTACVITVSDRSAAGIRPDTAGPIAVAALTEAGFECAPAVIIPDGTVSVADALRAAEARGAKLVITTGGTGVGPRDQTPEGTLQIIHRQLPGIAEAMRAAGADNNPMALISRAIAGVTGRSFIVNLPGSPRAVAECLPVVLSVARHIIDQLEGSDHA